MDRPPPEGLATRTHFTLLVMTSEYTGALRMGQDFGETVIIGLAGLLNQPSCYRGGYLDPLIILRVVQRPVAFGAFKVFVILGVVPRRFAFFIFCFCVCTSI